MKASCSPQIAAMRARMAGSARRRTSDCGIVPDLKRDRRRFSIWRDTARWSALSGPASISVSKFARCTPLISSGDMADSIRARRRGDPGGNPRPPVPSSTRVEMRRPSRAATRPPMMPPNENPARSKRVGGEVLDLAAVDAALVVDVAEVGGGGLLGDLAVLVEVVAVEERCTDLDRGGGDAEGVRRRLRATRLAFSSGSRSRSLRGAAPAAAPRPSSATPRSRHSWA